MTDYITEMMETAGIEPVFLVEENSERMKAKATFHNYDEAESYQSKFGGDIRKCFDFTAEKQLEIIKLIMKIEHFTLVDKEVSVTSMKNKNIGMWCKDATSYSSDFTQALAQLTTELMRAGELDKEKVKEVL